MPYDIDILHVCKPQAWCCCYCCYLEILKSKSVPALVGIMQLCSNICQGLALLPRVSEAQEAGCRRHESSAYSDTRQATGT